MLRWNKSQEKQDNSGQPSAHPHAEQPPRPVVRPAVATPERKSLPQLLLEEGKVSAEQLERLIQRQKETGVFLGELLVEEGVFEEQSLISFLAKYCKIPHLSLLDYLIDPGILELIPREVCIEYRLLPIDKMGSNLTVAMVNPLDTRALEKIRALCPDLRIKPILCAYKHFETVTARVFGASDIKKKSVDLSASSFGLRIPRATVKTADTTAKTREDQATVSAPATPDKPAPTEKHMNSDALVDNVFNATAPPKEPEEPRGSAADSLSNIMEELTTVMMDSMRDTYDMLARRMELFNGLKADDVAKIFARGDTIELEADQVIFKKGEPGTCMYIILGGGVLIYDEDREIARLARGDMFGEMALVSHEPRSASARAAESSSLLALSMDIIRDVMPRDVSVQLLINIVITLSARLRQANVR